MDIDLLSSLQVGGIIEYNGEAFVKLKAFLLTNSEGKGVVYWLCVKPNTAPPMITYLLPDTDLHRIKSDE